jgi:hypothetical protein
LVKAYRHLAEFRRPIRDNGPLLLKTRAPYCRNDARRGPDSRKLSPIVGAGPLADHPRQLGSARLAVLVGAPCAAANLPPAKLASPQECRIRMPVVGMPAVMLPGAGAVAAGSPHGSGLILRTG